jgi:hypothetical protein
MITFSGFPERLAVSSAIISRLLPFPHNTTPLSHPRVKVAQSTQIVVEHSSKFGIEFRGKKLILETTASSTCLVDIHRPFREYPVDVY